jgi:Calmodulin-binding
VRGRTGQVSYGKLCPHAFLNLWQQRSREIAHLGPCCSCVNAVNALRRTDGRRRIASIPHDGAELLANPPSTAAAGAACHARAATRAAVRRILGGGPRQAKEARHTLFRLRGKSSSTVVASSQELCLMHRRDDAEVPLSELLQLRPCGTDDTPNTIASGFLSHREEQTTTARRRRPDFVAQNAAHVQQHDPTGRRKSTTPPGPRLGPGLPPPPRSSSTYAVYSVHTPPQELPTPARQQQFSAAPHVSSCFHSSFGRVPAYLARHARERHEEALAADVAARAAAEAAAVPPGMRPVDSCERAAALELLRAAREDVLSEVAASPMALNTEWRMRKRAALESTLSGLDEAIMLYQQPRAIYLPIDTPKVTLDDAEHALE